MNPSSIQIFNDWKIWYPYGVKIVPRNISLTPTTCLVWLMDDGCASSDRITFSTHTFVKEDVDYLIHLLDQIGIDGKREKVSKPPKDPNRKEPYWKNSRNLKILI